MNVFPNDENGNVLRDMEISGDDLSQSRDVDFSLIFYNESMALEFCATLSHNNMSADCYQSEELPDLWDVTVTSHMVPTHQAISSMEEQLARLAAPFGGKNDGWGCFAVPRV